MGDGGRTHEQALTPIAALGDVVGQTGDDQTRQPGHEKTSSLWRVRGLTARILALSFIDFNSIN